LFFVALLVAQSCKELESAMDALFRAAVEKKKKKKKKNIYGSTNFDILETG
jgi:hypothetical protein